MEVDDNKEIILPQEPQPSLPRNTQFARPFLPSDNNTKKSLPELVIDKRNRIYAEHKQRV